MGGYKDLNLRRAELGAAGVAMTLGLALETRSPRGLGFRLLGFFQTHLTERCKDFLGVGASRHM